MKRILITLALGLSATNFPMELIKQPFNKLARMCVVRAISLGATIVPAVAYAQKHGYTLDPKHLSFTSDKNKDLAAIVAPILLTALGTRSASKIIAPRLSKTNTCALIKGATNYSITDWLFFENSATKKVKDLWKKYSYKI